MDTKVKDPQEVLDYLFDWSDLAPDTVVTSVVAVPDGLTLDSKSESDTGVTVWLSGGTDGASYVLTNRVVTADGRTHEKPFRLLVVEKAQTVPALTWVTLPEAEAYFAGRLGASAWHASTEKLEALVTAEGDLSLYYAIDATNAKHKRAVFEQAFFRLTDTGMDRRAALQAQGVTAAGMVKETFGGDGGAPICWQAKAVLGEPMSTGGAVDLDDIAE